jgi:hypothetical protein
MSAEDIITYREEMRRSALNSILVSLRHAQETDRISDHERFTALEWLEKVTKQ